MPAKRYQAKVTAVKLRLKGETVANVCQFTGLSAPTVINAHKLFLSGGWEALEGKVRGRVKGTGSILDDEQVEYVRKAMLSDQPFLWTRARVTKFIQDEYGLAVSERAATHLLARLGMMPDSYQIEDFISKPALKRLMESDSFTLTKERRIFLGHCFTLGTTEGKKTQLVFQSPKRKLMWSASNTWPTESWLIHCLSLLLAEVNIPITLILAGVDLRRADTVNQWAMREDIHQPLHLVVSRALPEK
ncbi:helix-turn-helix domain-containing protein [Marinomonas algicola]|uniref:helix-turn-helix domain-containing protein n=1 Tax=Marinomonas algicola TaxID=2773454 RepID=UPI00174DF816|nr:helix-turn-helix domain-containing protein [Marinomonas algicola]